MKETSTENLSVGQPADIILQDGTVAVGQQYVEPVDPQAINKDYLDALKFMEEEIVVLVQESSDQNAENPVQVGVNGVFAQFFRGIETRAKRKFVDALCVKNSIVQTPEFINGAGERAFKIVQRQAMKYPFMVIRDGNPKGGEWLKRRLAEVY